MMGNRNFIDIDVKLPFTSNDKYSPAPDFAELEKKFGYKAHKVRITKDLCSNPAVSNYNTDNGDNTNKCNEFYKIYCTNVLKDYMNNNNGKFDMDEFLNYSPNCSCYVPAPPVIEQINLPHRCFVNTCSESMAYLDPRSRENPNCQTTICANTFNLGNLDIGENSNFIVDSINDCGPGSSDETSRNNNSNRQNNAPTVKTPNVLPPTISNNNKTQNTSSNNILQNITDSKNKPLIFIGSFLSCLCCIVIIILIIFLFMNTSEE